MMLESLFRKTVEKSSVDYYYIQKFMRDSAFTLEHKKLIIDVGSGRSPFKNYISHNLWVSIDRRIYSGVTLIGDIRSLPLRKEIADAIVCTQVLEHVMDINATFQEFKRVLSVGGYLVLTIPLIFGVHDNPDFWRFTDEGIRHILQKYNFKILKIKKKGGVFSTLGLIIRQIPQQVFGPFSDRTNYLKWGFLLLIYLLLIPITRLCILLDVVDQQKNFTIGYGVLATKVED
ncbi:MAG: class I SAM-dependent methyltransferase [Candidatus Bathyarchaeota archaeon]|jgi:SAM-dependent methyltransferase